jgi:hypothetical protein
MLAFRHSIGDFIRFGATPHTEHKIYVGFKNPSSPAQGRCASGKEHCTKLTKDKIEGASFGWKRQVFGLVPGQAIFGCLLRRPLALSFAGNL